MVTIKELKSTMEALDSLEASEEKKVSELSTVMLEIVDSIFELNRLSSFFMNQVDPLILSKDKSYEILKALNVITTSADYLREKAGKAIRLLSEVS